MHGIHVMKLFLFHILLQPQLLDSLNEKILIVFKLNSFK